MNKPNVEFVFIEVSDLNTYREWDIVCGYQLLDQITYEENGTSGVFVLKQDEEKIRQNVAEYEKYRVEIEQEYEM